MAQQITGISYALHRIYLGKWLQFVYKNNRKTVLAQAKNENGNQCSCSTETQPKHSQNTISFGLSVRLRQHFKMKRNAEINATLCVC